jgi:glycine cleavage system T protein (aminomethyltransferase)
MAQDNENASDVPLQRTPLHDLHVAAGAKMVPFAGYEMPINYPLGVLGEHQHTRAKAGLFDVSHMGQAFLIPDDSVFETAAAALEKLVPADILGLKPDQQRYSQLLSEEGGILDDLMITRIGLESHDSWLYIVVNGACKNADYAHMEAKLPANITLRKTEQMALVALQGPKAAQVLARLAPEVADMDFMTALDLDMGDFWAHVSRSGYTGEDGYEIAIPEKNASGFWERLCEDPDVEPVGLGARDSLRLEGGLCLYGYDIDETTSPIEARLAWSIAKRRRAEGGFPGADRIQRELRDGPTRKRVGILPEGPAPAREGTIVHTREGGEIGIITSGGFGPSFGGPVAMGYVASEHAATGTKLDLMVRGKARPAAIAAMPFVPANFYRGK